MENGRHVQKAAEAEKECVVERKLLKQRTEEKIVTDQTRK
jgi:hypothetical protein